MNQRLQSIVAAELDHGHSAITMAVTEWRTLHNELSALQQRLLAEYPAPWDAVSATQPMASLLLERTVRLGALRREALRLLDDTITLAERLTRPLGALSILSEPTLLAEEHALQAQAERLAARYAIELEQTRLPGLRNAIATFIAHVDECLRAAPQRTDDQEGGDR